MIEKLQGTKETVLHTESPDFKLYMNVETENYPIHWHTDLEIIMPLENIYTVVLEEKNYVLHPYDIIIIPSGSLHELIAPEHGQRLIFQVSHSILQEVNGFDSVYNKFFPCAVFRSSEKRDRQSVMISLLEDIISEYFGAQPLFIASIHALTIQFFVEAGRIRIGQADTFVSVKKQKQQAYIDTFLSVCSYINNHCTEALTLEELADMAGFSKSHFIRLFKEFAGVSCYEYLTKRRMIYADILLSEPEYSITEVAMQSGFNSLATFNRIFKANHHCTPMEYRKRIRKYRKTDTIA